MHLSRAAKPDFFTNKSKMLCPLGSSFPMYLLTTDAKHFSRLASGLRGSACRAQRKTMRKKCLCFPAFDMAGKNTKPSTSVGRKSSAKGRGFLESPSETSAVARHSCSFFWQDWPVRPKPASAVRGFKPSVVYPHHTVTPPRGGANAAFDGMAQDVTRFKQFVGTDVGVAVRVRSWYADYQ